MHSLLARLRFELRYFSKPPWDTGISPPELLAHLQSHPPGRALDLGCGTGTNVLNLAQAGWQVTGVDFAARAIRQARRKLRTAGAQAELLVGDVTELRGVSGPFDLILDMGCFHNLDAAGQRKYAQNVAHLLAPGGTYLLYTFFRPEGAEGRGLLPGDMEVFQPALELVQRVDGTDRGRRLSAWFTYRKPLAYSKPA